MDCYEAIDLMGDAIDDRLGPDARRGLQGHLDECPPCSHYFDQLRVTRGALGRLPAPEADAERRDRLVDRFRREFEN
jgi:anti-sigma factor RsiW